MTTTRTTERHVESAWALAIVAGLAGGLVRPALVAVAGAAGLEVGRFELALQHELPMWWAVHVAYSVVFALVYDAVASGTRFRSAATSPATGALLGCAYGVVLWTVNVAVVWRTVTTYLLPVFGTGASTFGPLVGHVVYGAVLGWLYPLLRG